MTLTPDVPSLREALRPFTAVIVTGGSSGLGKSFIQLGSKLQPRLVFCNLSRREPARNNTQFTEKNLNHFPCDASRPDDVERAVAGVSTLLAQTCPDGQILLINNAGFGAFGRFGDLNLDRQLEMVDVNVRAVVHLTGRFLPVLHARGGAILNVASTVAYQPTPYAATYGATKAFVLHWTLALNEELRGTNVRALAVCPGTTRTDFFRTAGMGDATVTSSISMSSDEVVAAAYRALGRRRSQFVPGWANKAYTFVSSKLPKPLVARIAGRVLRSRT